RFLAAEGQIAELIPPSSLRWSTFTSTRWASIQSAATSNFRYIWLDREFILLVPPLPMLRSAFLPVLTEGMTPEVMSDFESASQARRSSNNRWRVRESQ